MRRKYFKDVDINNREQVKAKLVEIVGIPMDEPMTINEFKRYMRKLKTLSREIQRLQSE